MNHTILTITKIEGKSFSFVYGDIDIPEEWYGQFIKVYSIKYNVKNKYIRFHINNKLDDNVICIDVHPIVYKDLDILHESGPLIFYIDSCRFWVSFSQPINEEYEYTINEAIELLNSSECHFYWEFARDAETISNYRNEMYWYYLSLDYSYTFIFNKKKGFIYSEKLSKEKIRLVEKNSDTSYTIDDYPIDLINIKWENIYCIHFRQKIPTQYELVYIRAK